MEKNIFMRFIYIFVKALGFFFHYSVSFQEEIGEIFLPALPTGIMVFLQGILIRFCLFIFVLLQVGDGGSLWTKYFNSFQS